MSGKRARGRAVSDLLVGWSATGGQHGITVYACPTIEPEQNSRLGTYTSTRSEKAQPPVAMRMSYDDAVSIHRSLGAIIADASEAMKPPPPTRWDIDQAREVLSRASSADA